MARRKLEIAGAHGCNRWNDASLLVLDRRGTDVCGTALTSEAQTLASHARSQHTRLFAKVGSLWAVAQPVRSRSGQEFAAVLLTQFQPSGWFPHLPPFTIPVSALVTFIFAYLLTKPVRALRSAFRQFAAGDMSARLPVARSPLGDWGGADIRTLMIDFNEMADRIQELLEAHKTLLRDVSHELRSPLARLNVALELARDETGQETQALDRAELESNRLNTLIGELLSLSLMESTNDVPNSKTISLGEVIQGLMPDLMFEANARHCRVIHKRQHECQVFGSEDVLRRALENVIRNAIRYSPSDGEVLIETCTEEAEETAKSVVRICDSGPGVPEESLQTIFRPFYRVDSARQNKTGGFGVGLAIAERAVQIHGGTIRAFNRQSGGLCVELLFPCVRPN